jgi:hypothetical protein
MIMGSLSLYLADHLPIQTKVSETMDVDRLEAGVRKTLEKHSIGRLFDCCGDMSGHVGML